MTKRILSVCLLAFIFVQFAGAQSDPKEILEKSFFACLNLDAGTFKINISKKAFNEKKPLELHAETRFLKVEGDSSSPFKFFVTMNNGDGTLCTSNDLVQLRGSDSTGTIYSRSSNQGIFRGAFQSEGLFPPFFQPQVVFSLDRIEQTTFIIRQGKDEEALGKSCYSIKLIDLIRATLPDGQRQEKTFLIDKETFLPVFYSEKSVTKLGTDSLVKENTYRLAELSTGSQHDSLFTFKNIPAHFRLRNIPANVYHHHLKEGIAAPDFTGKVLKGDSITLKSFAGKKVVLFFFHRTSYPSLKALSAMQQFQDQNKDVRVLLIGIDANENDLAALLSKRNITLNAIEDGQPVADKYFITAVPSFIFIDEKGIVRKIENGYGAGVDLRY